MPRWLNTIKQQRLLRCWLWPLWIFEVLTTGKSFRDNPILGQIWLNRLGLHVLRYLLAHGLTQWRWWQLRSLLSAAERTRFHRDGYLQINHFLPAELFAKVVEEAQTGTDTVRQLIQQDTLTQRFLLDEAVMAQRPALAELYHWKRLDQLLKYCGARQKKSLYYAQVIKNGVRNAATDPQKQLHSDTFHPTLKAWLFLADVSAADGPLTYVPGSHQLTKARLKFEYQKSITVLQKPDGYSEKGSLRITPAELQQLQLPEPIAFVVPANTLVLVNTHGFHARGKAEPGRCRPEIWIYSRHNPFFPFAGVDIPLIRRLSHQLLNRLWQQADAKAASRGKVASWAKISPADFEQRHDIKPVRPRD